MATIKTPPTTPVQICTEVDVIFRVKNAAAAIPCCQTSDAPNTASAKTNAVTHAFEPNDPRVEVSIRATEGEIARKNSAVGGFTAVAAANRSQVLPTPPWVTSGSEVDSFAERILFIEDNRMRIPTNPRIPAPTQVRANPQSFMKVPTWLPRPKTKNA